MVERHEDTGAGGLDRNRVLLDVRLGRSAARDIRLRYERDAVDEISLTAGWYW